MLSRERITLSWYETISDSLSAPAQQSKHTAMWWWCNDHPWFRIRVLRLSDQVIRPSLNSVVVQRSCVVPLALVELCLCHVLHDAVGVMRYCVSTSYMNWCWRFRYSVKCCGVRGFLYELMLEISILGEALLRSRISLWTYAGDFDVYFPELLWTYALGLRYPGWTRSTMNCTWRNLEMLNLVMCECVCI